jgi:hypothetical protein
MIFHLTHLIANENEGNTHKIIHISWEEIRGQIKQAPLANGKK